MSLFKSEQRITSTLRRYINNTKKVKCPVSLIFESFSRKKNINSIICFMKTKKLY